MYVRTLTSSKVTLLHGPRLLLSKAPIADPLSLDGPTERTITSPFFIASVAMSSSRRVSVRTRQWARVMKVPCTSWCTPEGDVKWKSTSWK